MSLTKKSSNNKKKSIKNASMTCKQVWLKYKLSLSGGIDMQVSKFVLLEQEDGSFIDNLKNGEADVKLYTIGIKESNNETNDEWGLTLQEMNELTALGAELVPSYRNEANEEYLWQNYIVVRSEELGQKIWDEWFTPRLIANIMSKPSENF